METKRRKFKSLRGLFRVSSRWTQGYWARCSNDQSVDWNSDKAVSWCLRGGLAKIYGKGAAGDKAANKLRSVILKLGRGPSIVAFNDSPLTTIEDIRRVVKKAKV